MTAALRRLGCVLLLVLPLSLGLAGDAAPQVPEPAGYRMDEYRAPVPVTLEGARVIDTAEAERLWRAKAAVFLDVFPRTPKPASLPKDTVWRDPSRTSISGATWLANVGYGVLSPAEEAYFRRHVERLTQSDKARTIVLFCRQDCWMSWNAGKRLVSWGYTSIAWYPAGSDGWEAAHLPTAEIVPVE